MKDNINDVIGTRIYILNYYQQHNFKVSITYDFKIYRERKLVKKISKIFIITVLL